MRIVHIETLISRGAYPRSSNWKKSQAQIVSTIRSVDWPPGSGAFSIYPESGKKSGKGNGVKPIKKQFIDDLCNCGWREEICIASNISRNPGNFDVVIGLPPRAIVVEWETGNISSSHRSLNKMALYLMNGMIRGAALVVPSRTLYRYLTDRIGNYQELEPYLDLWRAIPCENGVLEIIVIEHDSESLEAPRIPKGTDGRSRI